MVHNKFTGWLSKSVNETTQEMTRSCEGHFGHLTEFVDDSRTRNRRQDTKMMARTGVSQELQNSDNTIDRIYEKIS